MIKKILLILLSFSFLFCISVTASENDTNFTPPQAEERRGGPNGMPPQDMQHPADMHHAENPPLQDNSEQTPNQEENFEAPKNNDGNTQNRDGFPPQFPANQNNAANSQNENIDNTLSSFIKNYSTPITSVVILIFAFIFVIFYKNNRY